MPLAPTWLQLTAAAIAALYVLSRFAYLAALRESIDHHNAWAKHHLIAKGQATLDGSPSAAAWHHEQAETHVVRAEQLLDRLDQAKR